MSASFARTARICALCAAVTFGLAPAIDPAQAAPAQPAATPIEHKVYGIIASIAPGTLALRTRGGRTLLVDVRTTRTFVLLRPGRPIIVNGPIDALGTLHALTIWHTFPDAAHWPPDR